MRVLYEDRDLIAVDKPAGLHTAPLRKGETDTLLAQVLERCPEIAALPGIKPSEPGLLHRLDRDTSGVVLLARTEAAFQRLRAEFAGGRVHKEYLALCAPTTAVRPGQRCAMESHFAPYGPGRRMVRVVPAGQEGPGEGGRKTSAGLYHTEVEVLEVRGSRALVRARIVKGFRHQVRAHLAHLGLPLAGDPLYGVPASPGACGRLYLHASAVELEHPASGVPLRIGSPLPPDFALWYGGDREGNV